MIEAIRAGFPSRPSGCSAQNLRIRTVRRFARRDDGVAAVEFAMVAAPFLALMFAIMETAMVFFAGQTLETAAADSARLIMTGQAQTQRFTRRKFKQAVCAKIYGAVRLQRRDQGRRADLHVLRLGQHCQADRRERQSSDRTSAITPGGPGDIVVVRLMYSGRSMSRCSASISRDLAGNKRLIMATAAFRNEPYQ